MWVRRLQSGQEVSYEGLPYKEVVALATALDEWERLLHQRKQRERAHERTTQGKHLQR